MKVIGKIQKLSGCSLRQGTNLFGIDRRRKNKPLNINRRKTLLSIWSDLEGLLADFVQNRKEG